MPQSAAQIASLVKKAGIYRGAFRKILNISRKRLWATPFEEFGGKLLPGRTHIVITHQTDYKAPKEVIVAHSIGEAIAWGAKIDANEIFIIGGGQIYTAALPFADRLYLTLVDTDITGPVTFPEYESQFSKIVSRRVSKDDNFAYEFVMLER